MQLREEGITMGIHMLLSIRPRPN